METWKYIPKSSKIRPILQLGLEITAIDKELKKSTIRKLEAVPDMIDFIERIVKHLQNGGYSNNDIYGKMYEEGRNILTKIK